MSEDDASSFKAGNFGTRLFLGALIVIAFMLVH
jgi:hypothetical protein